MKQFFMLLALFTIALALYSQNKITLSGSSPKLNDNEHWNLNKYVWSYTHYKTTNEDKPAIDFAAIDNLIGIGDNYDLSISPDGNFFAYGIQRTVTRERDSLIVQSTGGSWHKSFEGKEIKPGFFSGDSKQYIFQVKQGLCFLNTGSGECKYVKDVLSYNLPTRFQKNRVHKWLAYQVANKEVILKNLVTGKEKHIENVTSYKFDKNGERIICQLSNISKELLIYNLTTEQEKRFPWVTDYLLDENTETLLLKTVEKVNDIAITELQYLTSTDETTQKIWSSSNNDTDLDNYALDKSGNQVTFVINSKKDNKPCNSIWYWRKGMNRAILKVNDPIEIIENGILTQGAVLFSDDGKYIYFNLQSQPEILQPEADAVKVDVWSYKDTVLRSFQPFLSKDHVVFTVILNLENGRLIQGTKENEELINQRNITEKQNYGETIYQNQFTTHHVLDSQKHN